MQMAEMCLQKKNANISKETSSPQRHLNLRVFFVVVENECVVATMRIFNIHLHGNPPPSKMMHMKREQI